MESLPKTTLLENAIGFTISGSAQVIQAGHDAIVQQGFPPGLPGLLRPVSNAMHTRSGPVARCDTGTRLEAISVIKRWVDGPDKQPTVCWLKGPAGYGKSALAQTIAERYAAKGRLLGSFFFLRGAGERSHISRLIPTLAHQISLSIPAAKPLLEKALRDEPAMLEQSVAVAHQFQKLIIDPIHSTSSKFFSTFEIFSHLAKQWVLVIDALDECDDKAQMVDFIDVLINASRSCLPFRLLITSRVEEHIRKKFDDSGVQSALYHLDLENFNARSDIQLYLEREFGCIYNQNLPVLQWVPQPWPSPGALRLLLNKAGSSFLFAVTLIKWIKSSTMPDEALQHVLSSKVTDLDPLYKQVLLNASHTPAFDQILGTTIILSDNPSIHFLSCLLRLQPQKIVHELLAVQSIIKLPEDDDKPVTVYHTSLRDFLTIQSRSEDYFINPPLCHIHLAMDCLKCLAEDSSEQLFYGDAKRYASLKWPNHILLGLQEYEQVLDEGTIGSLVYLIGNLLTLQGKTWFNTILRSSSDDGNRMLESLKAAKALFQGLLPAEMLFKLFQQVLDFHEREKRSFLKWEHRHKLRELSHLEPEDYYEECNRRYPEPEDHLGCSNGYPNVRDPDFHCALLWQLVYCHSLCCFN